MPKTSKIRNQVGSREITSGTGAEQADIIDFQVICLPMENINFGLDVREIREIGRVSEILPGITGPDNLPREVDYHGEIMPLFDLRLRLGLPHRPYDTENRIIITDAPGGPGAFVVDQVTEILRLDRGFHNSPGEFSPVPQEYISGRYCSEDTEILILDNCCLDWNRK